MAHRFGELGLKLGVCARTRPSLDGQGVLSRSVDVTRADEVEDFAREVAASFGRIDLWVNNAGQLGPLQRLADLPPADFLDHLMVNVMGVVHGSAAFARQVRRQDEGGVLVNLSSGAGKRAYAGWSAYCAGKAAVDRITEAVALEEASSGLVAFAVSPGMVDTDMQEVLRSTSREIFPALDKFLDAKANGHFNTPEFVADRVLALAFDPAHRPASTAVTLPADFETRISCSG
jgi:NAD(P)-dependent dehydrogenase (short-subunit alcohol dehydrogenase family)